MEHQKITTMALNLSVEFILLRQGKSLLPARLSHLKVAEHFAIWRAKFGFEWDVKPVFNDKEVIQRNKHVAEEIAAMG